MEATTLKYKQDKERLREYYLANRERLILKAKQYAKDHPESVIGYKKKWAYNNPDKHRQAGLAYRLNNKEKINSKCRKRYRNSSRQEQLRAKQYRINNKQQISERKKLRWNTDIVFRLKECLRNRLRLAIKKRV